MTPSYKDEATDAVSLEPCPLCGGKAEIWRAQDNGFTKPLKAWIACMNRCCAFITQEHTTNEEAITAWNRRVSTNKDETIANLLRLLERAVPMIPDYGAGTPSSKWHGEVRTLLTSTKKEG